MFCSDDLAMLKAIKERVSRTRDVPSNIPLFTLPEVELLLRLLKDMASGVNKAAV